MKAVVWTKYGSPDALQYKEVPKPVPKDNELLIRVEASTVTAGDCEVRSLKLPLWIRLPMRIFMGFSKPTRIKILGQELAGEIEAVGKDVKRFKVGDAVFASTGLRFGGYGEYACLPENGVIAIKPNNMTCEEAAAVPTGGLEALHFMRQADVQPGQSVLINGAGGSIGTFGVQLAKHLGAEVTAVDSTEKLEMLRSLGVEHVIDYTQEDFTRQGKTFDVIFDVIGKAPLARSIKSLKANGQYLMANPRPSKIIYGRWITRNSSKKVISQTANQTREDLIFLRELIETGKIQTIIDKRFPLEQTAVAHQYVETGQKKGNVIIVHHL